MAAWRIERKVDSRIRKDVENEKRGFSADCGRILPDGEALFQAADFKPWDIFYL